MEKTEATKTIFTQQFIEVDNQEEQNDVNNFWRRLMHRWLIEYNPFYLLSSMLVLGGITLISLNAARENIAHGQLIVAAITEVYSWALIGGAALLTRIGLRRPGVMLALITVFFQGDLALHTTTSVHLGTAGIFSALIWFALFIAKLFALSRAVRIRLSPSAIVIPVFGAFGLVLIPRFFHNVDGNFLTVLVSLWVFALFTAALWTKRTLTSRVSLDEWGETVLRRSKRATWLMWGALVLGHVLLWSVEYPVNPAGLVPVGFLLATRWVRREFSFWAVIMSTLILVGLAMPDFFALTCIMTAVIFVIRAFHQPVTRVEGQSETNLPASPYRMVASEPPPPSPPKLITTFVRAHRKTQIRLFTGAGFGLYLSAWTVGWSGGAWPEHVLTLDLILGAAVILGIWKVRAYIGLIPLLTMVFHVLVERQMITAPSTKLGWGALSVSVGFVLLLACLAISWWLQKSGYADQIPSERKEKFSLLKWL